MDPTAIALGGAVASVALYSTHLSSVFPDGQQVWVEWMTWAVVIGVCKARLCYWHRATTTAKAATPSQTPSDEERSIPSPSNGSSLKNSSANSNSNSNNTGSRRSITLVTFLLVAPQLITIFAGEAAVRWALPIVTVFVLLANHFSARAGLKGLFSLDINNSVNHGELFWSDAIVLATAAGSSLGLIFSGPKFNYHVFGSGFSYAILTAAGYYLLGNAMSCEESSSSPDIDRCFLTRLFGLLDAIGVRAFAMCTMFLALTSTPIPGFLHLSTLVLVTLRVTQVFSIVTLCSSDFPFVAAAIATATAVECDDMLSVTRSTVVVDMIVAVAALAQAHRYLPKTKSSRVLVFALLLVPLVRVMLPPLAVNTTTTTTTTATTTTVGTGTGGIASGSWTTAADPPMGSVHPIAQLVKIQRDYFHNKLSSQSETVEAAAKEYIRRWGRPPPPGFGKWFKVAKSKDFLFIDELDTVMQSLEPFWGVSPSSLRARVKSVQRAERITSVSVGYDSVSRSEDNYLVDSMKVWLNYSTWGDAIPEVNFVLSLLDEPRVVVPDDSLDLAMQGAQEHRGQGNAQSWWGPEKSSKKGAGRESDSSTHANKVEWISIGQQHAWEVMVSSCDINDPARRETNAETKNAYPFVGNVTAEMDVCASSDRLNSHGFFASPQSLVVTHSLVPIFSQCKPSIFNDILYPSPYYQEQMTSGDYSEDEDPAWNEKLDRLYWAGASTGGFTTLQNWMKLHRQRLALMTSPQNTKAVHLLERDLKGDWQPRVSSWQNIANLFYTRLTAVIQCSDEACEEQQKVFTAPREDKSAALSSKYLLDIDGNSFSGRYYRLLKSKSAVLKYTVFKEWHDDRLIPWLHYIPVSNSAQELGETMRFLVDEPEGRKIGETIASESREWTQKTLREEDLEVVFIRVLMEYARIINDDRDTMNFEIGHSAY